MGAYIKKKEPKKRSALEERILFGKPTRKPDVQQMTKDQNRLNRTVRVLKNAPKAIAAEKAKSPIVKCKPTGNKDEIYGTTLSDKTFQALCFGHRLPISLPENHENKNSLEHLAPSNRLLRIR